MENPTPVSSFPQSHSEIEMENQRPSPPTIDPFSASASSSTAVACGYDCFINHRGPDTKKKLAIPLYRLLISRGFRAFIDQEELEVGLDFSNQLVGAIRTASVHVAIFSPTYAESQWCLDELHLMQETGARIIPIFYGVKPSDLRWVGQNRNGLYARPLQQLETKTTYNSQTHQDEPRYDSATLQKWRNALISVSNLQGFVFEEGPFNHDEGELFVKVGELLDKVVECVGKIMATKTQLFVAKYPTGLDDKVKDLEITVTVSRAQQHIGKAQVVGIFGPGGVGKTTLAKEFFNRKRSEYKNSYFLSDVRENAKSSLHSLQIKLLKGLNQCVERIDDIHSGTEKVKKFLSSSEVLLILDDIDNTNQVDALLPDRDAFSSNSLILITSRDKDVLASARVEKEAIYKLKGLTTQQSLELFCSYAFCHPFPLSGFENLVVEYLKACDGLPLSLKVFGALLWQKGKSFWEERLHHLQVPNDMMERLKISYVALHEKEQQVFLDIACFLIGEKMDSSIMVLWDEPGWKGSLGFRNLESKCLVEVDSDNCIHMHDHLRDLGREIARGRRLWHPTENIDDLLQPSSGITELRGIRMFPKRYHEMFPKPDHETLSWYLRKIQCYRSPSVGAMELQLLTTGGYFLERILRRVHTPNLTWLSWRNCPYSYMPSWIPMKNLRVLKVQGEVFIRLWKGRSQAPFQLRALEISGRLLKIPKSIGQLQHLERIFLSYVSFQKLPEEFCNVRALKVLVIELCSELKALPHFFGKLTTLQHIALSGCGSLVRLPESFGKLTTLQHMALSGCGSLERLPESFGNLTNLQHMELSWCGSLERLPESFGNLTNLQHMELSWCGSLERLPESFGNLTNLLHMELSGCESLERLPESFGNLTNLQHMELSWCESLERLPESFGNLTNLQRMILSACGSLERLPESFGKLTTLRHMELSGCGSLRRLPESFGNLTTLRNMALSGCGSLGRLPESFGNLTNLRHMELYGCRSLRRLPESFGNLSTLRHMELSGCQSLERLPESFGNLAILRHMELSWCGSLGGLPESFGKLTNLQHMALSGCGSLGRLPESFGNLTNLQHMALSGCGSLGRLPESFGNLTNLQHMALSGCGSWGGLPESFGKLTNLQHMALSGCWSLRRLPESFCNLANLQHMELSGCGSLERLPESFGNLTNLQHMELSGCGSLRRLPESFGNLANLQHMELSGCKSLETLPSVKTLVSLEELRAANCKKLNRIRGLSQLRKLRSLDVEGCIELAKLDGVEQCISLQTLKANGCPNLKFGNGVVNKLRQQNYNFRL